MKFKSFYWTYLHWMVVLVIWDIILVWIIFPVFNYLSNHMIYVYGTLFGLTAFFGLIVLAMKVILFLSTIRITIRRVQ